MLQGPALFSSCVDENQCTQTNGVPTPQTTTCKQFFDSGVHVREDIDVYVIEETTEICFKPTGAGWCYANTEVRGPVSNLYSIGG